MTSRVILPTWPSCYDCIDWSKDNQLVVLSGEAFVILTPRLGKPGPDGNHWDSTIVPSTTFTDSEVTVNDPLTFRNLSFGEELSPWQVIAGSWSNPGLAEYGGCALAVLTSNHVLSIWTATGASHIRTNWKREVIVNQAIQKYHEGDNIESSNTLPFQEEKIVRQRVTSFAWSSMLHMHGYGSKHVDESLLMGYHLLAVTTEGCEILVIKIRSPHDYHLGSGAWDVSVIASFNIAEGLRPKEPFNGAQTQNPKHPSRNKPYVATAIAWEQWTSGRNLEQETTLAFIAMKTVCCVKLTASNDCDGLLSVSFDTASCKSCLLSDHHDATPPLRFIPNTSTPTVIAFGEDTVFQINCNEDICHTHDLDDRWDEVTGAAFTFDEQSIVHLDLVSHLSSSFAPTAQITLPFPTAHATTSSSTAWRPALEEAKDHFDSKHGLRGHVLDRTWGIASSPLRDCIATCSTIHPSMSIAYMIPSDYTTYLNINWTTFSPEIIFSPGTMAKSSNNIFFVLQRYLDRADLPVDGASRTARGIELLQGTILHVEQPDLEYHVTTELDWETIVRNLRLALYLHPEMQRLRASRIAERAGGLPGVEKMCREAVAFLVKETSKLLQYEKPHDTFSRRMFAIHEKVSRKLECPIDETLLDTHESFHHEEEKCEMCSQHIPFESLKWARCTRGHQFTRCALSFLCIQKPGLTKSCGICDLNYLKGIEPDAPDAGSDNALAGNAKRPPLASIVFAACHVCVHCGGRYVS